MLKDIFSIWRDFINEKLLTEEEKSFKHLLTKSSDELETNPEFKEMVPDLSREERGIAEVFAEVISKFARGQEIYQEISKRFFDQSRFKEVFNPFERSFDPKTGEKISSSPSNTNRRRMWNKFLLSVAINFINHIRMHGDPRNILELQNILSKSFLEAKNNNPSLF